MGLTSFPPPALSPLPPPPPPTSLPSPPRYQLLLAGGREGDESTGTSTVAPDANLTVTVLVAVTVLSTRALASVRRFSAALICASTSLALSACFEASHAFVTGLGLRADVCVLCVCVCACVRLCVCVCVRVCVCVCVRERERERERERKRVCV